MVPSLGTPQTEHILNLFAVNMQQPEIVAIPPRMDVPLGIERIPNRSHVSELVPTNGGTLVTCVDWDTLDPVRVGVFATTRAVSANNRQEIVAHKHAIKGIRVFPS
jgi:hypothetical protein